MVTAPSTDSTFARDSTAGGARGNNTIDQRIERLSTASLQRVLEPDVEVTGAVGEPQVLPDELLSIADLPEVLARHGRDLAPAAAA
jgi:hypothetical protein